jgi:hypothetical protein
LASANTSLYRWYMKSNACLYLFSSFVEIIFSICFAYLLTICWYFCEEYFTWKYFSHKRLSRW